MVLPVGLIAWQIMQWQDLNMQLNQAIGQLTNAN